MALLVASNAKHVGVVGVPPARAPPFNNKPCRILPHSFSSILLPQQLVEAQRIIPMARFLLPAVPSAREAPAAARWAGSCRAPRLPLSSMAEVTAHWRPSWRRRSRRRRPPLPEPPRRLHQPSERRDPLCVLRQVLQVRPDPEPPVVAGVGRVVDRLLQSRARINVRLVKSEDVLDWEHGQTRWGLEVLRVRGKTGCEGAVSESESAVEQER